MGKMFGFILENFGFNCKYEFMGSMVHTQVLTLTLPIAGISSIIESYFGLQGLTVLSFVLLITLELISGICASKVNKEKISSRRFSRFGFKLFVWVTLLFILNSLRLEYSTYDTTIGKTSYLLFNWLHSTVFIYVNLEYLISVLENLGVISGKKKGTLISAIKNKLKNILKN